MDESDEPPSRFATLVGVRYMDSRDQAWTYRLAFWNTVGTIIGAISGICALAVSVVAVVLAVTLR